MPLELNGSTGVQGNSGAFVAGTAVATTSGTSIDFTGIPSWVKRITVVLQGVSTSGTSQEQIQLGTSGGVVTTGYTGQVGQTNSAPPTTGITTGLRVVWDLTAASLLTGQAVFFQVSGNTWVGQGTTSRSDGLGQVSGTFITLGGTLDRIRLTTTNGTDTFDAGSVNILYE
jgi:hypothetical protein